jgi:hypothetical protein
MPTRRKAAEPEVAEPGWRIVWGTHTWTENDLTTGDILELSLLLGNDWAQMMPTLSPVHRASFLMVLEARATGEPFEVVRDRIRAAPAIEFLEALRLDG